MVTVVRFSSPPILGKNVFLNDFLPIISQLMAVIPHDNIMLECSCFDSPPGQTSVLLQDVQDVGGAGWNTVSRLTDRKGQCCSNMISEVYDAPPINSAVDYSLTLFQFQSSH